MVARVGPDAGDAGSDYACGTPGCGGRWPIPVRFCPFCGRAGTAAAKQTQSKPASPGAAAPAVPPPAVERVLRRGANAPIDAGSLLVQLRWNPPGAGVEADAVAFLLTTAGCVRDDGDMLFWSQRAAADGAVRLQDATPDRAAFSVELARLPAQVARVVFCLSITGGAAGAAAPAAIAFTPAPPRAGAVYEPDLAGSTDTAVVLAELYRRGAEWKVRAIGQGFLGGLTPLARSYGVDVAD